MPFLVCTHLARRTEWSATITSDPFTLGFSETASVPLPDRTLAPQEVVVERSGGDRYQVTDLAEQDRVRLNGAVIRAAMLKDGDVLQVGRILVRFHEEHERPDLQVVLSRPGAVQETPSYGSLEVPPAAIAQASAAPPPQVVAWRLAVVVAIAFVLGVALGLRGVGFRSPAQGAPAGPGAERTATGEPPESARAPAPEAPRTAEASETGAAATGALDRLRRQLGAAREGEETAVPAVAPAEPASTAVSSALLKLRAMSSGVAPSRPDDPWTSRRRLHRLFLDLVSRSPTREEERDLLPLGAEERWRRVVATGEALPAWIADPAEAARALLGRALTEEERRDLAGLTTGELPASYWLALGDEYARADRRRPRSARQLAGSLVVDLLDRKPAPEEVEAVLAALKDGAPDRDAIRTIARSPRSRIAGEDPDLEWMEPELFRFLLREPTDRERTELARVLRDLDPKARRRWLLEALASMEEYRSY